MKNKMLQLFPFLLFVLFYTGLQAQESLNAAGGIATGNGTVSWSAGQVAYQIHTGTNESVSEGVQQPSDVMLFTFQDTTFAEICENNTFTWRNNVYTQTGIYYDSLLTTNPPGYDSVYVLFLTVHPSFEFDHNEEICDGDIFSWRGNDYTLAGTYYDSLLTINNCDSVYILNLTVKPSYLIETDTTIWDYEFPFVWESNLYWAAGTYFMNYQTIEGCDSVLQLNLMSDASFTIWVNKEMGTAAQANWTPHPLAERYEVRYSDDVGGGMYYPVAQTTNTTRKLTNLEPNTDYFLEIRARVNSTWTPWDFYDPIEFNSGEVDFWFTQDIGTKAMLHWTELEDVSNYIVQYKTGPGSWMLKGIYTDNETVMGGLDEDTEYEFRLIPRYNNVGFWQSAEKTIKSNLISFDVDYNGGETADFEWNWAQTTTTASEYFLQIRQQGTQAWSSYSATTDERFVDDLTAGLSYEYRLVVRYGAPPASWGATSIRLLDNPNPVWNCGDDITFTYNGTQVTYGTVESNGRCWLDRNLGASQVAASSTDHLAYGDLFQWGRGDDGHQNRSIASVAGQSSLTTPTGGQAGKFLHGFDNWYNGSNPNDLWQGVSGTNNPCPSGWRVPTEAEWNTERLSWAPDNNATGAINSPLKLPLAGYRTYSNGSLNFMGSTGYYWSSSVLGAASRRLDFYSGDAVVITTSRAFGYSLRCIKDCPIEQPTQGTHTPSQTQIIWNWNTAIGADGYKYNTVNNYATATDNGASTSYTQEGLDCGTTYILYVWAYNNCGVSAVVQLNQFFDNPTECPCGIATVPFTYNGTEVIYGTVESLGECWLDRNLGASQVATSSTDHLAYGDLFQWGRAADGHQLINWTAWYAGTPISPATPGACDAVATDTPPHSNFIQCNSGNYDWRNPQNHSLWQGVSGTNNPCPSGWRVPTEAEWNTERTSWGSQNHTGAINSPLKLPLAGYRWSVNGSVYTVGSSGLYWSSSVDGAASRRLTFSSGAGMYGYGRAHGISVRCIKE